MELSSRMEMADQNRTEGQARGGGTQQPHQELHSVQSRLLLLATTLSRHPLTTTVGTKDTLLLSVELARTLCVIINKTGHPQKIHKSKQQTAKTSKCQMRTVCQVKEKDDSEEESELVSATLFHLQSGGTVKAPPIEIKIMVDDCPISMEVDTGPFMSLMSETTYMVTKEGPTIDRC